MTEDKTEPTVPTTQSNQKTTASAAESKTTKPAHRKNSHHFESRAQISAILITFVVMVLAVFFGAQYFMRSGVFQEPGKLIFANTTTEENQDFVNTNLSELGELHLQHDVTIGALTTSHALAEQEVIASGENSTLASRLVLYDILLPVTSFNDPTMSVAATTLEQGNLTSIWDLSSDQKLLSVTNTSDSTPEYYLDSFDRGGLFKYLQISGQSTEDVDKVTNQLRSKIAAFPNSETVMTLAQTGVTALSRRMNSKLQQVGDATYFSSKIAPFLRQFDFTHTSNEASFSVLANGSNICSAPAMIDVLTDIGLDIVELTGNHNQDCGDDTAIATIEQYHDLGIQTFGGGISAEAAAIPLELTAKSNQITLLGYNLSTGGYTLDNTPGANFYTTEKAQSDITAAKARGDTVIVDIQYYECNSYVDTRENTICDAADSSAGDQVGFFRSLIDLGADVVVGTAAHQPQTYEQYHGGEIYYGLGNLFFDQSAWPGTTRSLILVHYFWQNQLIQTRIVPTIYDQNFQTALMSTADATQFLARLLKVQPAQ